MQQKSFKKLTSGHPARDAGSRADKPTSPLKDKVSLFLSRFPEARLPLGSRASQLVFFFFLLLIGGLVYWQTAYGVTRTWDGGGGDANWNTALNWSGDTVPTSSDIASFDGTCSSNCSPTINVTLSGATAPAGINMASDYTGTITQSSTFTITVGASNWVQAGGTFTGGSGAITINGTFTLSGGTFTSTTGTLTVTGNWTHTAGGTFNHNNGTVAISGASTLDVATSETFNHFTRSGLSTNNLTITSGDTVIVLGTFTHTNSKINTGTIEARGNVSVGATAIGGTTILSFLVAGDQTITGSGGSTVNLNINKPSGTVSGSGDFGSTGFTLASGTFTSTSGTLTIAGDFTHTAGGTFNHNNGTVEISNINTLDVATSETFNHFTLSGQGDMNFTLSAGDTVIVLGTFTHTGLIINTGTIEARGNVSVGASANGGTATISFLVAGDQTITGSGGFTARININKPSGTVSGSGDFGSTGFTLASGTFTSTTGTLTIAGDFTHTAGGTFNHNNGTVAISGASTLDVATSETFNHFTRSGSNILTISAGDTVIVLGTLTHSTANINTGTIEARGNVSVGASANGGTATISFTGGNDQTYTNSGGNEPDGDITINKSGGIVTLLSNADWNASGQDLTITSGTLNMGTASYNLATTVLSVASAGTLINTGTGDLTLAGNVSNSGQIIIESNGTCGGSDDIQILSSVAGTQRTWSGAGTFTIYDATVKDQGGSAAITAYSSTSVSGNGVNWTFVGGACPTTPTATIGTGILNITSGIVNFR